MDDDHFIIKLCGFVLFCVSHLSSLTYIHAFILLFLIKIRFLDIKIVYKRYASLYFIMAIDPDDNELITLEIIHRLVEALDRFFGNVCELDLIFNFESAYAVVDEMIGGHGGVIEMGIRTISGNID